MNQNDNSVRATGLLSLVNKHENSIISKCTAHADNICKNFYEQEEFDIVLVTDRDKIQFPAHRIVLSASSDYFLAMFSGSFKEAKATEVIIKNIDGATLTTLLDFMYTGSIELRCETIEVIFKAADFFQMGTLVAACCEFIQKQLDATNCLGIAAFAEQHGYSDLNKFATTFALRNYEKVSNENEFLQLSEDKICKLISSDDLYVQSEQTLLLSVEAWVEYDKTNREKSILKLLLLVRFTSLDPKFIESLVKTSTHSVDKTENDCYELMCSWLEWHLSPEKRQLSTLKNTRPRKNTNGKLACISGERSNNLTLQTFDPDSNTWSYKMIPQLNVSKEKYRINFFNQKLIITGGEIRDSGKTNSVECFNILTNNWNNLSPMGSARSDHEATVIDGYLYVVGGVSSSSDENCDADYVERYDFSINRWEYLECKFNFAGAYAKILGAHLYAFYLNTYDLSYYDSTTEEYVEKNAQLKMITGFGCAEVCGKLYMVGGYGYDEITCSTRHVKCYNVENDNWDTKKSMKTERFCAHCTAFCDRLIVAGGYDLATGISLESVEQYDPEKNEWSDLAPLLPHNSSFDCDLLLFTM